MMNILPRDHRIFSVALLSVLLLGGATVRPCVAANNDYAPRAMIGATALFEERVSGLTFTARIDTGARLTSIHCGPGDLEIEQGSASRLENVGKKARLRVSNKYGESDWIDTHIDSITEVRNADHAEIRYCVLLPLIYDGIERNVVVTLKDRSTMTFALLIGRNFLKGAYVVDVSDPGPGPPGQTPSGELHVAQAVATSKD